MSETSLILAIWSLAVLACISSKFALAFSSSLAAEFFRAFKMVFCLISNSCSFCFILSVLILLCLSTFSCSSIKAFSLSSFWDFSFCSPFRRSSWTCSVKAWIFSSKLILSFLCSFSKRRLISPVLSTKVFSMFLTLRSISCVFFINESDTAFSRGPSNLMSVSLIPPRFTLRHIAWTCTRCSANICSNLTSPSSNVALAFAVKLPSNLLSSVLNAAICSSTLGSADEEEKTLYQLPEPVRRSSLISLVICSLAISRASALKVVVGIVYKKFSFTFNKKARRGEEE
mmetsp:Transcript_11474/g.20884  ORF Transcript_11474/g.20884 Transcript_11474/m.20884 type:complete len:286 (-) Transcript_11474:176-1033(-)